MKLRQAIPCAALALAPAAPALACTHDDSGKPTVGLVLSGGGALAASQVGAIKVLEELHVPIHCIVGTSMGAVVGALYAAAPDADKLKETFVNADWGTIATGTLPYRDQGFQTKEDTRDFLSDYVIGVGKDGITLPSGLSSLRGMRRYVRHETEQVAHETDFDRLPIPFRATATDLNTGEAVTLGKGDLVDAALASMAVPGLYPSQRIDGRVLVDGGMSKQVPIDIAHAMGADIIIVVDTTIPPPTFGDREPSVVDTVMQLVNLQVWRNRQEQIKQLADGDVLIQPDMKNYSTSGFDKLDEGFEEGYTAAKAQIARLQEIAAIAAPSRVHPPTLAEKFTVASVKISNASGISPDLIQNRLDIKPGDQITKADLYEKLDDVAALGVFDVVDYRMTPGPNGNDIDIATIPRGGNSSNQHLQLGLKFSTTPDGDAYYGVLGRWTLKPLNPYAGELAITAELGTNLVADFEWTQPVGSQGRFYVETGLNFSRLTHPVNIDEMRIAERRDNSQSLRLNVGRELGQWGLVSIGGFGMHLDSDIRVGDTFGLGVQSGDYLGATARFAFDTLNAPSFPISGQAGDLIGTIYESEDNTATAFYGSFGSAQTLFGLGTVVRVESGYLDQETGMGLPFYKLGGFKRLSGFEDNSIPGTKYGLLRLEVFKRLGADIEQSFGLPVYIGGTLEAADVGIDLQGLETEDDFYAGSIYGAVNTPLGPAYLAYGMGEAGRNSLYLYFGTRF